MKKINLAIVGATGMVGQTFIKVLEERKIKNSIKNLYLFSSEKGAGTTINFNKKKYIVESLNEENIANKKIDFAFFSAGENVSKSFAPIFNKYGITVIDNSSAFRMEESVPLIVPEINFQTTESLIIANPNCSTIQCVVPLFALQKHFGIKSIIFSTYQSVSGSGVDGIEDLRITSKGEAPKFYPYPIYNNCLPHIGSFLDNGYTSEEEKMIKETHKILQNNKIKISATCVRVPLENCHSVSVSVKLKRHFEINKIREIFSKTEGVKLIDEPQKNIYPICDTARNKNEIFVGRIRRDLFDKKTLHFWCVADNIRKGAATNGVQILEKILDTQK